MDITSVKDKLPYVGVCAGVAGVIYFIVKRKQRKQPVWPKDTVILHQFNRGPNAPNLSPFCLKVETYLKMANIPYMIDSTWSMSSKGKMPWITYNGTDVADSQFCIEYLNKKFDIDLNTHLTTEQKAAARAFLALLENHFQATVTYTRWLSDTKFMATYFRQNVGCLFGYLFHKSAMRHVAKLLWYEGTSRHTKEEVMQIAETDLMALSNYLGNKPYLMGSEPCETDCAMFGVLAQCVWHIGDTQLNKMVTEQFPNLREYCERVKEKYWPDWDDCITHDYTVVAKK